MDGTTVSKWLVLIIRVGKKLGSLFRYIQGRSQTLSPCVMALSAMGLKLGIFRLSPTTHAKTKAKQMPSWSLRTLRGFTCVDLHTQTAEDASDIRTWWTTVIFITEKTWRPPIWTPYRIKMAGCGISLVYLWKHTTFPTIHLCFM